MEETTRFELGDDSTDWEVAKGFRWDGWGLEMLLSDAKQDSYIYTHTKGDQDNIVTKDIGSVIFRYAGHVAIKRKQ